jgi:hypothetical protein
MAQTLSDLESHMEWIRLGGACAIASEVFDAWFHPAFLPLGGSHISQLMIVLGLAFVAHELSAVLRGSHDH